MFPVHSPAIVDVVKEKNKRDAMTIVDGVPRMPYAAIVLGMGPSSPG